jgi:hypothetical protein
MAPSLKQRLGGAFITLIGAWGTVYSWYDAVHNGELYEKFSSFMPFFLVLGIAVIFLPGYREERIARGEDIAGLQGWKLLTPRWRVVTIVALVLGFGNYFLLRLAFNWSE